MKPSRFFSALASLLFLAVCAYAGAALYRRTDSVETFAAGTVTVTESLRLDGIALRREKLLTDMRILPGVEDGRRISANETLAEDRSGAELTTGETAVFFADTDGFEYLSPDALYGAGEKELVKLLSAAPKRAARTAGRLVSGFDWYYAAFAESSAPGLEPGDCRIIFDGFDDCADAQLIRSANLGDGRQALLLRLTEGGADYLRLRRTGATLILSEYSRLKLPQAALRQEPDGTYFVYTLSAGTVGRRSAELIYTGDGFCLAEPGTAGDTLREGETVILSGKDIYEGKVLMQWE